MKHSILAATVKIPEVAPFAGAWIETNLSGSAVLYVWVAPFAGAWIETKSNVTKETSNVRSPPSRGRGLKLIRQCRALNPSRVAPFAGAWIETV